MTDSNEVKELKGRIAELETQLTEDREEFQWDLKAAKESAEKATRKAEEELAKTRKGSGGGAVETGESKRLREQVEMITQRALLAERRVAELQVEAQKRSTSLTPPPVPKADTLMKQRAEGAEQERDSLRKENRTLQRSLDEKEAALQRSKQQADETKAVRQQLEEAKRDLAARERELRQAKDQSVALPERDRELARLREELQRKQDELGKASTEAAEKGRKLQEAQDRLGSVSSLAAEVERLKDELGRTRVASSQMVEQREREAERLRSDLKQTAAREGTANDQAAELRRERDRIKQELGQSRRERDEAVSQLRSLRDSKGPAVRRKTGEITAARDPFDEKTQRAQADPGDRTQRIQLPRGMMAQQETAPVAEVPGSTGAAASDRKVAADSKQPVVDAEELFPEAAAPEITPAFEPVVPASPQVPNAEAEVQTEAEAEVEEPTPVSRTGISIPPDAEAPAPAPAAPLGMVDTPAVVVSPELAGAEVVSDAWLTQGESQAKPAPEHVEEPAKGVVIGKLERPPMQEAKRTQPRGKSRWVLGVIIFLIVAGGIVGGSLYFFPKWFGIKEPVGDSSVVKAPVVGDAGLPVQNQDAGPAEVKVAEPPVADASVQTPDAGAMGTDAPAETAAAVDGSNEEKPAQEVTEASELVKKAQEESLALIRTKKYAKLEKEAAGWVKTMPGNATAHYLYGRALFYRKKLKQAAAELEKSVELDQSMADAYYELGGVYLVLNQNGQAAEALGTFVKLRPADKRTHDVRLLLKKLQQP